MEKNNHQNSPSNGRNILLVSDDFVPAATGVGSHLKVLARELVKRGCRVVVITSRREGQPSYEEWNGAHVYRMFSVNIAGFYQAIPSGRKIKQILRRYEIGLIHHHYLSFLLVSVFRIGRKFRIPQIYTFHMSDELLSQPWFMRPLRGLIRFFAIKQYRRFDRIICPSKSTAREVREMGVGQNIFEIVNPVDFKGVSTLPAVESGGVFQVLYVGRLAPEKNIPLLLRAFAKLKAKHPAVSLRIAGEGGEKDRLVDLCKKLDISDKTEFLGHVEHEKLPHYFATCDVFVLPSVLEVQGIVVLEAMRFAKPVIVTDAIGCATELVDDNGFIVDSENEDFLLEKLELLKSSLEMRQRMGRSSLSKSTEYEPDKVVGAILQVYDGVL